VHWTDCCWLARVQIKIVTNAKLAAYLTEHHPSLMEDFRAITLQAADA
jgi:hypothetical protein